MSEAVNHPQHYGGDTKYETIKIIHKWKSGFSEGNAIKYVMRSGKKYEDKVVEDIEKSIWYLENHKKNQSLINKILLKIYRLFVSLDYQPNKIPHERSNILKFIYKQDYDNAIGILTNMKNWMVKK